MLPPSRYLLAVLQCARADAAEWIASGVGHRATTREGYVAVLKRRVGDSSAGLARRPLRRGQRLSSRLVRRLRGAAQVVSEVTKLVRHIVGLVVALAVLAAGCRLLWSVVCGEATLSQVAGLLVGRIPFT